MTALHDLSAQALSAAYRAKQLSPVEVTRAALERIAAWDRKINAMYVVDAAGALAQASSSEPRWRAGEALSALDGVPITIKDNIAVKGIPTPVGTAAADMVFRHRMFTVLWTATVVANIGTWMSNAASGWLMTSLDPDPLTVSLVQVATTLPMFLFAVPAGALADIFDKRRFLIVVEAAATAISAVYAALVVLDLAAPDNLLLFSFLIGAAGALTAPAWQSVVPQLVAKNDLPAAVAANSEAVKRNKWHAPSATGFCSLTRWSLH
jgi:hypothetical protein